MLGLRLVMLLCMAVALSTGLLIPVQTPLHQISSTHRGFCSHSFGSLGLRKAFSSSVALRMSDDDAEKSKQDELAALVKERDQLQKETDELMKRRQELLKQDVAKLMNKPSEAKESSPAAAQPALEKKDATAPKNEPFELFAKAKDTKMEAGTGETKKTTRGGFLRAFAIGTLATGVTLFAAIILSYPRLERLAYLQFSALFEQGALAFSNKLRKAIDDKDFKTASELTKEQGELEVELLQPMVFWAAGNADADVLYLSELEDVTKKTKIALDQIYAAAEGKDAAAADTAWTNARASLDKFVLLANQRIPTDIAPLSKL